MKVTELRIIRKASYEEEAGQLVGTVTLVGTNGSQMVRLSNKALSDIFAVITNDITATAVSNARGVKRAMDDAATEPTLLTATTISIEGESND